jgi:hypothetical protein
MSFEQTLQEKLGKHIPEEIQELILDTVFKFDKFTEDHKLALQKYTSLIHLSMNGIGLTSLENFPELKDLQILELNKNKIKGDDLKVLSNQCPSLYKLKIEENEIDSVDKFQCLTKLKIKKLNVLGNPLTEKNENYKNLFFEMFGETLESIDDKDKEGKDVESTVYGEEEDGEEEFDEGEGEDEEDDEGEDDDDGEDDEEGEGGADGEDDQEDDGGNEEEEEKEAKKPKAAGKKKVKEEENKNKKKTNKKKKN